MVSKAFNDHLTVVKYHLREKSACSHVQKTSRFVACTILFFGISLNQVPFITCGSVESLLVRSNDNSTVVVHVVAASNHPSLSTLEVRLVESFGRVLAEPCYHVFY